MKFSFVVSCNLPYIYSLSATLNAAKFYDTSAEFSIAYDEDISPSLRDSISKSFPFVINWYSLESLIKTVNITSKIYPNRFWLGTWILASNIVDKYDSIAILQADECLLNNVNNLFYIAAKTDVVIATEYTCVSREFEELPFGSIKSIYDRSMYAIYDQLVFLNKNYKNILIDVYKAQCVDPWSDIAIEAQDPLCALNQACATYLKPEKVLGLDAQTWAWDNWHWKSKLIWNNTTKKLYNDRNIRINAFHCRPWQYSIVQHGINMEKNAGNIESYEIGCHNFNLMKDIQIWLNNQTPITSQLEHFSGIYK